MPTFNPYLNFNGNTEDAFKFYRSVFGGEFATVQRFRDTPEAKRLKENELDKIMHIALPVGKTMVLMATDALESMGQKLIPGNNFHISIDTDSVDEANDLFKKLSAGGKVTIPMEKMFWGAYFGMLTDKFGIQWMVNHDNKEKS